MLITRTEVSDYLRDFLTYVEDRRRLSEYINVITDLSWMATIILEYGFQCPENTRKEAKKRFFDVVQRLSNFRNEIGGTLVNLREHPYQQSYRGSKPLTVDDFAIVCDLYHRLVEEDKKVPKDKLLSWLEEAWDAGVHQSKVYNMEIEGGIMNEYGIVTAFGAELAMFGDRKGLIPESCLK